MLGASIFESFDLDLCRKALDSADAGERIDALRRRNLLLAHEGEGGLAYHFHPILRAFLEDRRPRGLSAEAIRAIKIRGAETLEATSPEDALCLYLQVGMTGQAEALLRAIGRTFLDTGRLDALARVLAEFQGGASGWPPLFEGEIARLAGEFDRALALLHVAEARAAAGSDASCRGQALALQAACLGSKGDSRMTDRAREALAVLPPDDATGLALAHNVLGLAMQTKEPQEARVHLEAAREHYRRIGDVGGQLKVLHNLGLSHARRGDFGQALATYREALRQATAAGRHGAPATYSNLANVLIYQGAYDEAWTMAAQGLDLAQRLGFRREEAWCLLTLSMAAKGGGDQAKAAAFAEAALTAAIALEDKALQAQAMAAQAEVAHQGGALDRAWELIKSAIAVRDLPQDDPGLIDFKVPAARILVDRGAAQIALDWLVPAAEAMQGAGLAYRQAQVLFGIARALRTLGRSPEAEARAKEAEGLCLAHDYGHLLALEGMAPVPLHLALPEPPSSMAELTIRCFGSFEATRGAATITGKQWQGHKTKLILSYLLQHHEGASRDQLAEVIYGEEQVSRSAILMLLSRLRQALEPDLGKNAPSRFIQFREGRYYFNFGAKYHLDVEDFAFHLAEGRRLEGPSRIARFEQALALYRGRFLADLPGEFWVVEAQEHYHRRALEAFEQVLIARLDQGDHARALDLAERCLSIDSCAEAAHQAKMRGLLLAGNPQGAIRHYQHMEQILARELGMEPAPASRTLYRKILQGSK